MKKFWFFDETMKHSEIVVGIYLRMATILEMLEK